MIDDSTNGMISVWMGTSTKIGEEFNKYTKGVIDSDPTCPAFADFGTDFIDVDFFVAYQTKGGEIIPIETLAKEIGTFSAKTNEEIIKVAKEKGIHEGNSLYYYDNATFYETDPNKLYNGLKFIGTFKNPFKKIR